MNRYRTNLFIASLAVTAALNTGAANATDHRMWRDQVARPVDSVIKLESKPADPKKRVGNNSLLWREQIKFADKGRVFILEPAPKRSAKSSDTRLWREQVKPKSFKSELRAASKTQRTDKIQNQ